MAIPTNQYPYTDLHELNLDYILEQLRGIGAKLKDLNGLNLITYAGTWDVTKSYIEYSIVTGPDGLYYLALSDVPEGTPITDSTYWSLIGIDPSDLAALTARVAALEGSVAKIGKKRVIIMGDSYNVSFDGTTLSNVTSVGERITTMYGSDKFDVVANWACGGGGFNVKSADYTFNEYIDTFHSTIDHPEDVTDFLLFGGFNEIMDSGYAASYNGGMTFAGKVKTYFPNAKLHLACVGWGTVSLAAMNKIANAAVPAYKDVARTSDNAVYVLNSECIFHDYTLGGTDGIHPTDAGYEALAKVLGSYIANDNPVCLETFGNDNYIVPAAGLTGNNLALSVTRETENTKVYCMNRLEKWTGTFSFNSDTELILGTVSNTNKMLQGFEIASTRNSLVFPSVLYIQGTYGGSPIDSYYPSLIIIKNGNVTVQVPGLVASMNITSVLFSQFVGDLQTAYC